MLVDELDEELEDEALEDEEEEDELLEDEAPPPPAAEPPALEFWDVAVPLEAQPVATREPKVTTLKKPSRTCKDRMLPRLRANAVLSKQFVWKRAPAARAPTRAGAARRGDSSGSRAQPSKLMGCD